jgi:hypothetical protein
MKRLVALAALLLPLWGCAQPAEAPANVSTNANATTTTTNTTTTAPASTATVSEAAITDHEKQIWDTIKRKDYDAFGQMLADDFILVSNDGLHDKKDTVASIKTFTPTEFTFSNWKVVPIDPDAAVVTYEINMTVMQNGKPTTTSERDGSVWVKRGDKWVGIFHQDTNVQAQAAPASSPASGATKPANANAGTANANTAATPAGNASAETADPITKEKQLWEELKHKNWDAFQSDLAENAIEVEPDGVYDRAGSVAGVKAFDFSKYTLSDFKQVKIDDDATLVTYVVHAGGNHVERHSTVWTKKGDKWLALYHQGTPQGPPPPPAK